PPRSLLSTLFPYTTLFRSLYEVKRGRAAPLEFTPHTKRIGNKPLTVISQSGFRTEQVLGLTLHDFLWADGFPHPYPGEVENPDVDRKSTRLNSSHVKIPYA